MPSEVQTIQWMLSWLFIVAKGFFLVWTSLARLFQTDTTEMQAEQMFPFSDSPTVWLIGILVAIHDQNKSDASVYTDIRNFELWCACVTWYDNACLHYSNAFCLFFLQPFAPRSTWITARLDRFPSKLYIRSMESWKGKIRLVEFEIPFLTHLIEQRNC